MLSGLAAAIPVVNATVKAVRAGWVPTGDDGIIAIRAWDVLTSHTPLLGQLSEAGLVIPGQVLHSPGPILYWLIALPARFGSVEGITITMGVVNTLAIVGCVALARRRGGYPLMLASALAIALACQSLPTEALHDIWNPSAALFPFLLLVFVCWSLACGEHRLLPLAALLASFVVQSHLVFLLPTCLVLTVALVGLVLRSIARRRRGIEDRRVGVVSASRGARPGTRVGAVWRWALGALAVLAVCWTAPVAQQLEESPGNLSLIARTAEHRGHTLGAGVGWTVLARAIGERPWWLYVPGNAWGRGNDAFKALSTAQQDSAIAMLVALALVALVAGVRRRLDVTAAALIGLGLCGVMLAQVAANPASQLFVHPLDYTLLWGSLLGLWVWFVLAWALWLALLWLRRPLAVALRGGFSRVRLRPHPLARPGAGATGARHWETGHGSRPRALAIAALRLAGVAGVALVASAVAQTAQPDAHIYAYRPTRAIAERIERIVPSGVTIDYTSGTLDGSTWVIGPALRFLLVRHGDRVLAAGSYPLLGSYYALAHHSYRWVVYLGEGAEPQPHMRLVARMRLRDPSGIDVLSAWVMRAPARDARA